jgi:hypothetical protein
MTPTTTPFWLVWNAAIGAPRHRYTCLEEAEAEAERLAREHSGMEFIVLESVCSRFVGGMTCTDLRPVDIPF